MPAGDVLLRDALVLGDVRRAGVDIARELGGALGSVNERGELAEAVSAQPANAVGGLGAVGEGNLPQKKPLAEAKISKN